jgi:MOSC domain-containing protein YiiM
VESVGRVLQVNVSAGGVPKLPVPGPVRVTRLGLEGDAHREDTVHGGPQRAVSLFAIEAIRRVAADGHPIAPGTAGENLTTEGVELATHPPGTRLAIGDELVLEIVAPDNPCSTIAGSFSDGRFARISILTNPTDSRMYARVLREGLVEAGDPITVLPPAADSRVAELALLARLDAAHRKSSLAIWRAAAGTGLDLRIVDDGEIAMVAAPAAPAAPASAAAGSDWLNKALGLALLPNLVGRAIAHFQSAGTVGRLELDPADPATPAAEPIYRIAVRATEPARVADARQVPGLMVRRIGRDEAASWARLLAEAGEMPPGMARAWVGLAPLLAVAAHSSLWLAELDGTPVGTRASTRTIAWAG